MTPQKPSAPPPTYIMHGPLVNRECFKGYIVSVDSILTCKKQFTTRGMLSCYVGEQINGKMSNCSDVRY